jgi:uncharacterized protein (TIGR01777 family)
MTIVIAGGTGFLGAALIRAFRADGHRALVLTRRPRREDDRAWNPGDPSDRSWMTVVDGADAVINLAGESIATRRWTAARKRALRDSRVNATTSLVQAIEAARRRPPVLLSASAIGIYGNRGDESLTEDSAPGSDFLAGICLEWERLARKAAPASRVVLLRTGLVLHRSGGVLPPLALPFRLFVGGPVGSGRQYMSWIHLDDWVGLVKWALATNIVLGPLNLTAPAPVTNADFGRALGRALGRPSFMPTPAFALKLALGEMADALILGGQRVLPARAQAMGYEFRYAQLESALKAVFA